jgi:2-polyprenyl-3-methyl-5-hydroxy-6-metoxy-1,4-benzoquinol methylase
MQTNGPGQFFDSFAREFDTFYDGKRNPFMRWVDHRFRSDMFARFDRTFVLLGELSRKSVIDIGCGSGPYIEEALRRGASRVTGIDAARSMLDLVRQRIARQAMTAEIILLEGYFPHVTPTRSHDYGIVMGVMDYVKDATKFVEKLRLAVDIGAVVSFPSVHWLRSPVRRARYKWRRCPLFLYTEADIQRILRSAGVRRHQIHKLPGAGMDFVVWIEP